jgi:Putative Ig domain
MTRLAPRVARAALALAILVGGGTLVAGLATAFSSPAGASTVPPWEPDPDAVGALVFFNSAGKEITGGSINDSPLAAYVEGTATVRSGDSVATLYGYLPVSGEPTSEWSGEQLGLSTTFPDASAPAPLNTATLPVETGNSGDETIAALESDYPNTGTGDYANTYQLRLYTNAPHKSQTTTYDEADIVIDPTTQTWSVEYPAPSEAPTITSADTTTFVKGLAGKFTVKASGSPAPTFSEKGKLPGGVKLSKAGVLSGKAAATGTFPITITASNGVAPKATQDFTLTVVGAEITTASPLPKATVGTAYSTTLAGKGGSKPYSWSRAKGSKALPAGLKLGAKTGTISGTPTKAGTYAFSIELTTTKTSSVPKYTATKKFTLTVAS